MDSPAPTGEIPSGNGAGIDLKITVRDKDGRIVNEQCKEGDIYLYNWAVLVASVLKNGFAGQATSKTYYGIRQSDGAQLAYTTQWFYRSDTGTLYWGNNGRICLGSSSQAAAIRDYCLAAPVKEIVPSVPLIQQDGNTLKIVVSGTASFASETMLSECGLAICHPFGTDNGTYRMMITRDTFTATTVPAGGTITLQFELWFNAMPT
jgi:hypothetical protein